MTEKKRVETIELGTDPSLSWDIFKAAKALEYLLSFTPQYMETLKAVRDLIATNIEVTDKQQKFYVDVKRFSIDIIQRVREKEKEEEKDLPVIGRLTEGDNRTTNKEEKEMLRAVLNEGEKTVIEEQNTDWEKVAYEQKMKDMARLRPCKLCGGAAVLQPWCEDNGKESFSGESAGCPRCEIFVRGYGDTIMESREDAIEKWNRKMDRKVNE